MDTSAGICLFVKRLATRGALATTLLLGGMAVASASPAAQPPPQPPAGIRPEPRPTPSPGATSQASPAEGVVAFPGGVVWEMALPEQPAFPPAFDERRMFVALKNDTLTAVTLETGLVAWTQTQVSHAAPTIAGESLVGADGLSLWVRDAATGAPRWTRAVETGPLPNYVSGVSATRTAACVATASGTLSCANLADGSPLWQQSLGAKPTAGPLVAAGRVVVGFADGAVRAFALDTGRPIWSRATTGMVVTLSATDTRVIAGTDANTVHTLDAAKGKQRWKWRTGGDPVGSAIVVGKRLYYVAYDNTLRAHNLRNGHLAWARPLVSRPVGGPVSIGDRVLIASVAPHLRGFKVTDGTPDGVVALPGKAVDQPHLVAALGDLPPMVVVVTGGGQIQAIGQTIEPAVVPLESLPGTRLIPETLRR